MPHETSGADCASDEPSEPRGVRLTVLQPAELDDARRAFAEALRTRVRGDVRFGRHDRMLYATDASIYQVEPFGVFAPRDIADAHEALRVAAAHDVPVLPRGGGTALAGQSVNLALVVDFSQYCRGITA